MTLNDIEGLHVADIEYRECRIKVFRQGDVWEYGIRWETGKTDIHYPGWRTPQEALDHAKKIIDEKQEESHDGKTASN